MLDIEKSLKKHLKVNAQDNKAMLGNYYFQYYEDFPELINTAKLHVYYLEKGYIVDQYYETATNIEGYARSNSEDVYEIRKILE